MPSRSRYSFHDFLSFANNFNVNLLPYFNNLLYHFEQKKIDINVKNIICGSAAERAAFSLFSGPGFALRNRAHWLYGQAGANPAGGRAAIFLFSGPRFAHRNRIHWLCGQAGANLAADRAAFFLLSGPWFAHRNRIHWLCGQAGANLAAGRSAFTTFFRPAVRAPKPSSLALRTGGREPCRRPGRLHHFFQAPSSRSKTEFIGFAGRQARTLPPIGPLSSFFQARGSRSETEFIGFAGRQARTLPAVGPPSLLFQARCSRTETEFIGFADRQARTLPPAQRPAANRKGSLRRRKLPTS